MERTDLERVLASAAKERGCVVVDIKFDDDDNVFEVIIDREGGHVDLLDCVFVHRAVLAEFDRNIEDYSLTVSSKGISAAEADEMLKNMDEN